MNEGKFKEIVGNLRTKHKDKWEKEKGGIIKVIEEAREILLNFKNRDLTNEEVEKLKGKLKNENIKSLFYFTRLDENLDANRINHILVKEVLEIAINTNDENFDKMIDNFGEIVKIIRSNKEVSGVKTTLLTILSTILNYKYYMPTWETTIPESLRDTINISKFVGAYSGNLEDFKQFMKIA